MSNAVRHCVMKRRADGKSHRGVGGQASFCRAQVKVPPARDPDGKRYGYLSSRKCHCYLEYPDGTLVKWIQNMYSGTMHRAFRAETVSMMSP